MSTSSGSQSRPGSVVSTALAVVLGITGSSAVAVAQTTERVSVSSAGAQGDGPSQLRGALSPDGRFVAFTSEATNLVAGDTNGVADVFVRDRVAGTTTRVSVTSTGAQANGASGSPGISADGRFVVFESTATNLVASDTNFVADVFVHDRATATTSRVSVSSTGAQGDGGGTSPAISADGEWIAFVSVSSTLVPLANNFVPHVFLRHRPTGTTTLVSVSSTGGLENGSSDGPTLSADGRFIAFNSNSGNLVGASGVQFKQVFVRDRILGTTTLASPAIGGGFGNDASDAASISANGRVVAFHSNANDLVVGDTNFLTDVFVRDLDSGVTERVNLSSLGAVANAGCNVSGQPTAVSADGRYVVFVSWANNLVPGVSGWQSVYVRDRATGTTTSASWATPTGLANNATQLPMISSDGRFVLFQSMASNLVAGDTNATLDVFVRGPLPSPWTNLGSGLAGVTGVPNLIGAGTLVAGSPGSLLLNSARPSTATVLFVSLTSAPTPLQCGTLVPFPFALALSLPTDTTGSLHLPWGAWPAGVSGLGFYFQSVIPDPAAACGAAFSNALRGDAP